MGNRIKLIKDGGQYHLTIGAMDVWLNSEEMTDLDNSIGWEIYGPDRTLLLRSYISTLRSVAKEYSGKTIENIIQQLEARVKEYENKTSKKNPQSL